MIHEPLIGRMLKIDREKLGWSQENVTDKICSVSQLSKIENGKVSADNDLVIRLFHNMGIHFTIDSDLLHSETEKMEAIFRAIQYGRDPKELLTQWNESESILKNSVLRLEWYLLQAYQYHDKESMKQILDELALYEDVMNSMQKSYYLYFVSIFLINEKNDYLKVDEALAIAFLHYPLSLFSTERDISAYVHGDYDHCITILQEAKEQAVEEGNMRILAKIYVFYGNVYSNRGQLERAIHYYQKAKEIDYDLRDHDQIAVLYYNIGASYLEMKDYSNALVALNEAAFYQDSNHFFSKFLLHHKLSIAWIGLENRKKAEEHLGIASDELEKSSNPSELKKVYDSMLDIVERMLGGPYLKDQGFIQQLEDLLIEVEKRLSHGFYIFHALILIEAYLQTRQYKKAYFLNIKIKRS